MVGIAIINGDWNDADYVTETLELESTEEVKNFKKAINLLNKIFDGEDVHNSIENAMDDDDLSDSDKELLDWIKDYFPYGYEGNRIHDYSISLYTGNNIKRDFV